VANLGDGIGSHRILSQRGGHREAQLDADGETPPVDIISTLGQSDRLEDAMLGILVGLIGGTLSGLTGLGGGFIMVPLLVYLFGMTQHQAQGTSLTVLLPPLGVLAFWQYYKNGHVDVQVAILVAIGFALGGYLGGWTAQLIPGPMLRKGFAVMMAFIALDMFFRK